MSVINSNWFWKYLPLIQGVILDFCKHGLSGFNIDTNSGDETQHRSIGCEDHLRPLRHPSANRVKVKTTTGQTPMKRFQLISHDSIAIHVHVVQYLRKQFESSQWRIKSSWVWLSFRSVCLSIFVAKRTHFKTLILIHNIPMVHHS